MVYSSQKDIVYSEVIREEIVRFQRIKTRSNSSSHGSSPYHSQQKRRGHYQAPPGATPTPETAGAHGEPKQFVLGSFFGHVNRITEWTMEILVKKGFYAVLVFDVLGSIT